jgi:carbonic anhydrase
MDPSMSDTAHNTTAAESGHHPFPNTDELVEANRTYAETFTHQGLALKPQRRLAVVACMDSRMEIFQILGLQHGEAHIIRNAGGVVTDDVVRSLALSQRMLGTREIILVHHTKCGLHNLNEDQFKHDIEADTGLRPWWALESFTDPFANVAQCIRRLHLSPFIFHKEHIRGFVYDVDTGLLHEVDAVSNPR